MIVFVTSFVATLILFFLLRQIFRKRLAGPCRTCCFVILPAVVLLFAAGMLDDEMNELVEHQIFKNNNLFVHQYFQTSKEKAHFVIDNASGVRDRLLVFQHVPRTSGDAMRTHFMGTCDFLYLPVHPHHRRYVPPWRWTNGTYKFKPNEVNSVCGYFSRRDVLELERYVAPRPLQRFIFLREPLERVLSLISFEHHEASQMDFLGGSTNVVDVASRYWRDMALNAMVYQLGDQIWYQYRNHSLSDDQLLMQAKDTLQTADYVGFYEDLPVDFWHVHTHILSDMYIPFQFPAIFEVGAFLCTPRIVVRKFAARENNATLQRLRRWLTIDQQLYDFARQRWKPSLRLYHSYAEFALANAWKMLLFITMLVAQAACCWRACCATSGTIATAATLSSSSSAV